MWYISEYALQLKAQEDIRSTSIPWQYVYYFVVVGVTILLAYLAARYLSNRLYGRQSRGEWLTVLDVHVISRDNKVLLVKLGNSLALIAENNNGLQLLKEFNEDETKQMLHSLAISNRSLMEDTLDAGGGFATVLKRQINRIAKRNAEDEG